MSELIQIMDTTLRDGEQTSGVSFTANEKLSVAKILLEEVKVDRIEVASARVSDGEYEGVQKIIEWAGENGYLDRVEVLSFIDGNKSIDWLQSAGVKVANLLAKGSLKHVKGQLRKTPEEHLADIKASIAYAQQHGIKVNLYLEDWSNGMKHSKDYVMFLLDGLKSEPIQRLMLPDTLGILGPDDTYEYCKEIVDSYPELNFDFHPHNDYDLACANIFSAIKAGVRAFHTTVNGLGERAGNVPLSSVIAIVLDHFKYSVNVDETKLYFLSKIVERYSNVRIPANRPIIGDNVFTQTCGVHADGDNKDNLYFNDLMPERFGREREYALGKTAGKANIVKNLADLGIKLNDEEVKRVTARVIELGDKKKTITKEDLPYIVSDVLNSEINAKDNIEIINYSLTSTNDLQAVALIKVKIDGTVYEQTANGDGPFNAFIKALKMIYKELGKYFPVLVDYLVTIPPGGRTDALVETITTWEDQDGQNIKTRGLAADQNVAAINATLRVLNLLS